MHEALILVMLAPTFHTAFKNTACLSTTWAAACDQMYMWKHSVPTPSSEAVFEMHPDTILKCRPPHCNSCVRISHCLSLGLETNWVKSMLSVLAGRCFAPRFHPVPSAHCGWTGKVRGWGGQSHSVGVLRVPVSFLVYWVLVHSAFYLQSKSYRRLWENLCSQQ